MEEECKVELMNGQKINLDKVSDEIKRNINLNIYYWNMGSSRDPIVKWQVAEMR